MQNWLKTHQNEKPVIKIRALSGGELNDCFHKIINKSNFYSECMVNEEHNTHGLGVHGLILCNRVSDLSE